MHQAERLLAPLLVQDDRTARRTNSASASASRRRARGSPSTVETTDIEHDLVELLAGLILLGDTDKINLGIVGQFALFGHRDRHEDAAGKAHPSPLDNGTRLGVLQDLPSL